MKEVNLEEILESVRFLYKDDKRDSFIVWSEISKEVGRQSAIQAIDLCAENAEAYFIFNQRIYHDGAYIENSSILNTKNQIK